MPNLRNIYFSHSNNIFLFQKKKFTFSHVNNWSYSFCFSAGASANKLTLADLKMLFGLDRPHGNNPTAYGSSRPGEYRTYPQYSNNTGHPYNSQSASGGITAQKSSYTGTSSGQTATNESGSRPYNLGATSATRAPFKPPSSSRS